jgi:hypothetical protein
MPKSWHIVLTVPQSPIQIRRRSRTILVLVDAHRRPRPSSPATRNLSSIISIIRGAGGVRAAQITYPGRTAVGQHGPPFRALAEGGTPMAGGVVTHPAETGILGPDRYCSLPFHSMKQHAAPMLVPVPGKSQLLLSGQHGPGSSTLLASRSAVGLAPDCPFLNRPPRPRSPRSTGSSHRAALCWA